MSGEVMNPVHSDAEILGGTPVFVGTRVPFKTLIDYLAGGETLEEFLDDFPSVSHDQAVAGLKWGQDLVLAHAYSSRRVCTQEVGTALVET